MRWMFRESGKTLQCWRGEARRALLHIRGQARPASGWFHARKQVLSSKSGRSDICTKADSAVHNTATTSGPRQWRKVYVQDPVRYVRGGSQVYLPKGWSFAVPLSVKCRTALQHITDIRQRLNFIRSSEDLPSTAVHERNLVPR